KLDALRDKSGTSTETPDPDAELQAKLDELHKDTAGKGGMSPEERARWQDELDRAAARGNMGEYERLTRLRDQRLEDLAQQAEADALAKTLDGLSVPGTEPVRGGADATQAANTTTGAKGSGDGKAGASRPEGTAGPSGTAGDGQQQPGHQGEPRGTQEDPNAAPANTTPGDGILQMPRDETPAPDREQTGTDLEPDDAPTTLGPPPRVDDLDKLL